MLISNLNEKLDDTKKIIHIHFKRLNYASSRLEKILPLTLESLSVISDEQVSFIDQYIFRFAKIQDSMGEKLFPLLLETLGEEISSLAFIDLLHKLEKLGIILDKQDWLYLRKLRNEVSHEYPLADQESLTAMNSLFSHKNKLWEIFQSCLNYLESRK